MPNIHPFISPVVLEEISRGDVEASKFRLEAVSKFHVLEITEKIDKLANLYFDYTDIPEKARADAYHIACAAFYEIDYLVSWNFKHILSGTVKNMIQSINIVQGFVTPILCTPEEMLEEYK